MAISVQWGSLWNSTPPPLLCTARGGKTNRSTCIKRSSQDCESGSFESIVPKLSGNFWDSEFKAALDFVTQFIFSPTQKGFFSFFVCLQHRRVLSGESCRCRQRTASWLCTSHCLDTLGTFTRGPSWWTPTPSKTCLVLLAVKVPTPSVRVRAPLPPGAWYTNYPLTPCR